MKPKKPSGNGANAITLVSRDEGGWVRIFPERYHDLPEQLPLFLSSALADWFRQRPQLRLRTVAPMSKDGTTVELHAWFDIHVVPANRPPEKPAQQKSQ
jgi:hypothetical protein